MMPVERRLILHFPGFEALNAEAHRARYARAARQSGPLFDLDIEVGPLQPGPLQDGSPARAFEAVGRSNAGQTTSRIHVFDYEPLISALNGRPTVLRLATGFASAARVLWDGGLLGYVRHGWRFGLFFLFPFVAALAALASGLALTILPLWLGGALWHVLWSLPLAVFLFARVFLPFAERWHLLHLFGDWDLAIELARLRDPKLLAWLAAAETAARAALAEEADEIVVTSHSMGSGMAALVLGAVLEADPGVLKGRRLVYLTLGGATLQSALLRSAETMRAHIGRIARMPGLSFIEVQCLNDVVHFYRSNVVAACGHGDAPPARQVFIRVKQMLTTDHYRRIRRDALRVHRQYVLGSDKRSAFDFAVLTASPAPVASFALPPAMPSSTAPTVAAPVPPASGKADWIAAAPPGGAEDRAAPPAG